MQFSIQKKESGEKHVNITPLNGTMPNYTPQPPGTHFAWGLEVGETHWEVWRSKRSSQLSLLEVEKVVRIFEQKHELRMNMELWTYIADNLKGEVCTAAAVQELWTYIIWEWILHYIIKDDNWTIPTYSPHIHLCPKFANRIIYLKTLELEVSCPRSQSFLEVMANFQPPTSKQKQRKNMACYHAAHFSRGKKPHGWKFGFATHIWRQPKQLAVSRSYLSIKDHCSNYCP